MPSEHAKLSPSSAERWTSCPASIRMIEDHAPPQEDSVYAREGTLAHGLGEIKAGLKFKLLKPAQHKKQLVEWQAEFDAMGYAEGILEEMHIHTDAYVALIGQRLKDNPGSVVFLEQRLDTGVPTCWGTSDTVIMGPGKIEIIDFKYGAGVRVSAYENKQLRLYACGALDEYGDMLDDTETVIMTVHQPRMDNVASEEITAEELRRWRAEEIIPKAELALSEDAPFGPSAEACRWCPVAGMCRARTEQALLEDFTQTPEVIDAEELGEILTRLPDIKAWCTSIEDYALDLAFSKGEAVPGWKVVMSGGIRKINDPAAAIQTLIDAGFPAEKVADFKPKGIGVLEKLVGKKEFPVVLDGFISKTAGKPSLVPESDKRNAITPTSGAAEDFAV